MGIFKDGRQMALAVAAIKVGEKNAKQGMIEVKDRKTAKVDLIKSEDLVSHLKSILK